MGTPVQESNGVFLLMSYAHDKLGTVLHGRIFTIFLLIIVVIYCHCDREGGWSMEWRIGGGGSSDKDIFDRCILAYYRTCFDTYYIGWSEMRLSNFHCPSATAA